MCAYTAMPSKVPYRIRRRPQNVPRFWRNIVDRHRRREYTFFRESLLVLHALAIPCKTTVREGKFHIYVPPLLENCARQEIDAYARELDRPTPAPPSLHFYHHAHLTILAMLPLVLWHGWRVNWWNAPKCLPPPSLWTDMGMLDGIRIRLFHEWYRLACSLTLHADVAHLCSNVVFGSLFLVLLARLTGPGRALWLCLLGGVCGNGISLLLHQTNIQSLGFSTALFAGIGALAGFLVWHSQYRHKYLLPIAAAAALLAMLGTEGEHTDYIAHCSGMFSGLGLGTFEGWRRRRGTLPQLPAALMALLLPCVAWYTAFLN
ncbi:MAG: rhomboid family intramembrane serine protease [Desulfovibrio sp.]|nr:rhomboid family intramembrane serine protease [Desulfovibrio sp.]